MAKKGGSSPSLHKVIMVGSGGVGKSALTLQVGVNRIKFHLNCSNIVFSSCTMNLWRIMSQPKLTLTERKLCWMERRWVVLILRFLQYWFYPFPGPNRHFRHSWSRGLCCHQRQLFQKRRGFSLCVLNNRGWLLSVNTGVSRTDPESEGGQQHPLHPGWQQSRSDQQQEGPAGNSQQQSSTMECE